MKLLPFDNGFPALQIVASLVRALILHAIKPGFVDDSLDSPPATCGMVLDEEAGANTDESQPKREKRKYYHRRRAIADRPAASRTVFGFVRHAIHAGMRRNCCGFLSLGRGDLDRRIMRRHHRRRSPLRGRF